MRLKRKKLIVARYLLVLALVTTCCILVLATFLLAIRSGVHRRALMYGEVQIEQVTRSLVIYAEFNEDQFPPADAWESVLIQNGYIDTNYTDIWIDHDGDGVIYTYIPDCTRGDKDQILLYDDPDRWNQGVLTGFADGHVEMIPHDEFNRLLAQQTADSP